MNKVIFFVGPYSKWTSGSIEQIFLRLNQQKHPLERPTVSPLKGLTVSQLEDPTVSSLELFAEQNTMYNNEA